MWDFTVKTSRVRGKNSCSGFAITLGPVAPFPAVDHQHLELDIAANQQLELAVATSSMFNGDSIITIKQPGFENIAAIELTYNL